MSRNTKGSILLFMASLFWGSTFVAQEMAAKQYKLGAFTYQSVRMIIGAAVLVPLIFAIKAMAKRNGTYKKPAKSDNRVLFKAGAVCGAVLCIASCLQQIAIGYDKMNSGKIGFITAMYILVVPILYFFLGNKISIKVIIAAAMGVVGLYLISVKGGFTVGTGDIFGILCAVAFSVHILAIDHFAPKVDGVKLSCIQFFVCGVLAAIPMVFIERPSVSLILNGWAPILYAGIFSCGIAYTCQILGQQNTNPTVASLIMSLESVFAMITGLVILDIQLEAKEWWGCGIMFAAIVISQLPDSTFAKAKAKVRAKKEE